MAKRKDAEDWLEWAQAKYDAAQERFAWSDRSDSPTMDSYSTLISLIESGMASRAKAKADDQKARAATKWTLATCAAGRAGGEAMSWVDKPFAPAKSLCLS